MTDLLAARSQMAISLGFHIIFACIGMAMPLMMAIAHGMWLRTRQQVYLDLTKAWSRGVAIFFATGAVSGTALSFELGLLWPRFMEHAGAIIGMPFSWEGTAFFIEAIAIGLFLYGWDRLPETLHWFCGLMVGVSGLASGMFVIAANAWMNSPSGFDWADGRAINIDPWKAMFNDRMFGMGTHQLIASVSATGFAVAGLHGFLLLKNPGHVFHQNALKIALICGSMASLIQPFSGDLLAKETAVKQPLKLAAMEAHFHTEANASLILGGIPDEAAGETKLGIKIPYLLSILAFNDPSATVRGLMDFERDLWPPVLITHFAFQTMVGIGTILMLTSMAFLLLWWRKPALLFDRRVLMVLTIVGPLGFIAVETGWMVTEVGRQPWIIYNIMKTKDAVTPMPGLWFPFGLFLGIYLILSLVLVVLMKRQIDSVPRQMMDPTPP